MMSSVMVNNTDSKNSRSKDRSLNAADNGNKHKDSCTNYKHVKHEKMVATTILMTRSP